MSRQYRYYTLYAYRAPPRKHTQNVLKRRRRRGTRQKKKKKQTALASEARTKVAEASHAYGAELLTPGRAPQPGNGTPVGGGRCIRRPRR